MPGNLSSDPLNAAILASAVENVVKMHSQRGTPLSWRVLPGWFDAAMRL